MYLLSVLVVLVAISMVPTILSDPINQPIGDFTVPSWIKNNAGWWADGQIDDGSFVSGIQWLILNDVITIPSTQQGAGDGDNIIPSWVKNTAGWWAEDKIHDITFVSAIKYLINEGIIVVGQVEEAEETSECTFKGIPVTCPDEKEVAEISDFYMEVNGSNCCLNWGYVGEEYRFQIETFDKKHGNQIDGVTITAKIISKGGELRHDFGQVTTEDGIYKNSITIPSLDWYAENILSVTGEYYGVEKTIEKEFEVFVKKSAGGGCSTTNPFDISDRIGTDAVPNGIAFNNDGTKMFIVDKNNKNVHEYRLCNSYSMGGASYTTSFSISGKVPSPQSIAFNSDGTKMFILDQDSNNLDITEFALSTGFDISSASYTTEGCDFDDNDYKKPTAIDFNSDGTILRVLNKTGSIDNVLEYTLGTGFSIGTCSDYDADTSSDSFNSTEAKPEGMAFNDDGTKMFIVGNQNDNVYEYTLSTAYDVTDDGATLAYTLDISDQEGVPRALEFSSDGTKMFIVGNGNNNEEINAYILGTAWDISTATVI